MQDVTATFSLGVLTWLGVELELPVRRVAVDATFLDARRVSLPDFRSIHHRTETIEGIGDPLFAARIRVVRGGAGRWTLDLRPGDLQFFLGRFSLHRVTPNLGATTRLLLIMSFSEKPGSVGSVQRIRGLYGKLTDEHHAAADAPVRADALLD